MKIYFPDKNKPMIRSNTLFFVKTNYLDKTIYYCSDTGDFYVSKGCSTCKPYIITEMTEEEMWLEKQ